MLEELIYDMVKRGEMTHLSLSPYGLFGKTRQDVRIAIDKLLLLPELDNGPGCAFRRLLDLFENERFVPARHGLYSLVRFSSSGVAPCA